MPEEIKLTKREQKQVIELCEEATAIYNFMETAKLGLDWKRDTERFMAFTATHTKNLIKHSKTLTCWTIVIAITTLALIFSTITQIVLELR